jgi:hypothetical protein
MRLELEKDCYHKDVLLSLELNASDVDALVCRLADLKSQPDQHFHLTMYSVRTNIDVTISMQMDDSESNAHMTGFAVDPSEF